MEGRQRRDSLTERLFYFPPPERPRNNSAYQPPPRATPNPSHLSANSPSHGLINTAPRSAPSRQMTFNSSIPPSSSSMARHSASSSSSGLVASSSLSRTMSTRQQSPGRQGQKTTSSTHLPMHSEEYLDRYSTRQQTRRTSTAFGSGMAPFPYLPEDGSYQTPYTHTHSMSSPGITCHGQDRTRQTSATSRPSMDGYHTTPKTSFDSHRYPVQHSSAPRPSGHATPRGSFDLASFSFSSSGGIGSTPHTGERKNFKWGKMKIWGSNAS